MKYYMQIYDRKANKKNSKKWDRKADEQNSKVEKRLKK